jgi:hypothetical protein
MLGAWGATNLAGLLLEILLTGLVALVAPGHGYVGVLLRRLRCFISDAVRRFTRGGRWGCWK